MSGIVLLSGKILTCGWCRGSGRARAMPFGECDGCGGSGKRRECRNSNCVENGCGGYGDCFVATPPARANVDEVQE